MRHGLIEVHLPVSDFVAPTAEQLERGVTTILDARARGKYVAVHCGAGLGRTGTLLACYIVHRGKLGAREAIEQVRRIRPGSVESRAQIKAVEAYALRLPPDR
jgi:atypical dual specificity phosphatase